MDAKDLHQIAKTLYAMEQKRKKIDVAEVMQNERYHRTMSDEYAWARKPAPRDPIPAEVQEQWRKLAEAKNAV